MLHGHGDDAYRHSHKIIADFSTNVWHGNEPEGLKDYVFSQWHTVNRYPEVLAESLAAQVATHYGVQPSHVLISSGTTESIYLVAHAWAGERSTVLSPAFSEYEDACLLYGHQLSFLPWEELSPGKLIASDLLFVCNPNNPTGSVLEPEVLKALLTNNPRVTFVLDEAFIEFANGLETAVPLVAQFDNLLVMRSLTKAYAIPGLRLGYVVASEKLIGHLTQFKAPWTVNSLAVAAGRYLFAYYEQVQLPISQLLADKADLVAQLIKNTGLTILPSRTHYFLAATRHGTAAELKRWLLAQHGLLIRDAANFRGLTLAHFRIGTRSAADNQLLVNALIEWNALHA